ncbi:MAG: murein L,D-transpeptidase catalytic domain family protein [Sphingomonadales bacterium]|nr:murein L,D-transpeptidase catalytic domain family protein [Sphingomonadales bacterium]
MEFSRRRFIGTVAGASAGLIAPRSFASPLKGGVGALLPRAMAALNTHASSIRHHDLIGIVDFGAPSHVPRFHLVDVGTGRVVRSLLVAHGKGSDPANSGWVARLSNKPGSNASCEGSFVTGESYVGKHGRSRRLIGLEPENNQAENRGIVVHAASYVDDRLATTQGRIGRSLGCFAVAPTAIEDVLARLDAGRMLFASR